MVQPVLLVQRVLLVLLVLQVQPVPLALRALLVPQVQPVLLALRAQQVLPDLAVGIRTAMAQRMLMRILMVMVTITHWIAKALLAQRVL